MQLPPQPGEVWINIHTSAKANIVRIEDVPGADGGKVIVYTVAGKEESRCNIPQFVPHWKRHKSASAWHLGTDFNVGLAEGLAGPKPEIDKQSVSELDPETVKDFMQGMEEGMAGFPKELVITPDNDKLNDPEYLEFMRGMFDGQNVKRKSNALNLRMTHSPEVESTLEAMRVKLSKEFGVTVVGNRVTLRWYEEGQLIDAHMIVENVTTPSEARESDKKYERMNALIKKYEKKIPGLAGELYYAETGESRQ